ncbi:UDP-glucose:(heptosyl)LPS alpha-1,3-glucosyltransferase [Desulfocicer vacuolatum DSM 3385]|uniref:UDP-glucose:(Heptosyl)LPS alpha-1,3-glucosyltransferase n=1 Tax=Desulfocicer vacuolatum DSM 3385 TaxID=1121400 RepID=A0A1W1Z8P7_9BACT|nr:glycosyltransferase family 4 protein [Desulfocicer vacuolatum]SMC44783.1 UDP-glucose:(heptosyl)LPS alpha-1,3-glucosyltransferase [Desulfocicer vacuolatum DSM 3385]
MDKPLKLAFCLFKYFPFGGLQVNFINIAKECMARGHKVIAYTISWEGDRPPGLDINIIKVKGLTNHSRYKSFARRVNENIKAKNFDALVGFNKMPGLDLYYGADVSYAAKMKKRSRWHRYTPRYQTLMAMEKAVFEKKSKTDILLLTEKEKQFYMDYYGTAEHRFHIMPPGISRDCLAPANADEIRSATRNDLSIDKDTLVLLMVCTNFKIKGVARAICALSSLPCELLKKSLLLIVGKDTPRPYRKLAKKMKVQDNIRFIGARKDVPRLLLSADFLLHPASIENTGTVIVEALAANVPVLTTDICGYSSHVKKADGGKVVGSPFNQKELNSALVSMLTSNMRKQWQHNCRTYVKQTDIFSRAPRACDIIEKVAL